MGEVKIKEITWLRNVRKAKILVVSSLRSTLFLSGLLLREMWRTEGNAQQHAKVAPHLTYHLLG